MGFLSENVLANELTCRLSFDSFKQECLHYQLFQLTRKYICKVCTNAKQYTCVYVSDYIYMYTCMCVGPFINKRTSKSASIYMHTYICMSIAIMKLCLSCRQSRRHQEVRAHVFEYLHKFIHTYTC